MANATQTELAEELQETQRLLTELQASQLQPSTLKGDNSMATRKQQEMLESLRNRIQRAESLIRVTNSATVGPSSSSASRAPTHSTRIASESVRALSIDRSDAKGDMEGEGGSVVSRVKVPSRQRSVHTHVSHGELGQGHYANPLAVIRSAVLETEDKPRLIFVIEALTLQLQDAQQRHDALQHTVENLIVANERETARAEKYQSDHRLLQTRLLSLLSQNVELQGVLERLQLREDMDQRPLPVVSAVRLISPMPSISTTSGQQPQPPQRPAAPNNNINLSGEYPAAPSMGGPSHALLSLETIAEWPLKMQWAAFMKRCYAIADEFRALGGGVSGGSGFAAPSRSSNDTNLQALVSGTGSRSGPGAMGTRRLDAADLSPPDRKKGQPQRGVLGSNQLDGRR